MKQCEQQRKFTVHFVILKCFNCTWKEKRKCYENLIFCSGNPIYVCSVYVQLKLMNQNDELRCLNFVNNNNSHLSRSLCAVVGKLLKRAFFRLPLFRKNLLEQNEIWFHPTPLETTKFYNFHASNFILYFQMFYLRTNDLTFVPYSCSP